MNLIQFDNVIKNPEQYLEEVIKYEFVDEQTGEKAFGDIQQRNEKDEFSDFVLSMFLGYEITLNFILNNALGDLPINDESANIICFLYLDKNGSEENLTDATLFIDDRDYLVLRTYNKFNRMVAFDRNSINFLNQVGLVQVLFLKKIK
jgi:hypothetical protein